MSPRSRYGPVPGPSARYLTAAEIEVQVRRTRRCDFENRCPEEVRVIVTNWEHRQGSLRRIVHFYCSPHGEITAGWRAVRIDPAPGGER